MWKILEKSGCLVLGGGVVGAAVARALAERGERVLLLERFTAGHTQGSSHGASRIFRFAYPEAIYRELAARALSGWRGLERDSGGSLFQATGNLYCGPLGAPWITTAAASLREGGFEALMLSHREVHARFPRLALPEGFEALFHPDGGVLFADRCLTALWNGARAAGAQSRTHEEILGVEIGDGHVELAAAGGRRYRAERLVVAAGSWSRTLLAQLDCVLPLSITREQVAYVRPKADLRHGLSELPTVVDHESAQPFYALPEVPTEAEPHPGVKVGQDFGGRPITDPNSLAELDRENLEGVLGWVRRRLPHLEPQAVKVEHCLYTATPDRHFILDHHPSEKRVTIAAGFSGHGFKFGPALGEVLAALALGEEPALDLEMFALSRFGGKG